MNAYANRRFAHGQPSVTRKTHDISLAQGEQVLLLVEVVIYSEKSFLTTLLSALPTPSLAQGGQVCGLFNLLFYSGK